ncbi:MAG: protein kinase [Planctomycetota bacterium]
MISGILGLLGLLVGLALVAGVIALLVWLVILFSRGIAFGVGHVARYVGGMIGDSFRLVGAIIAAVIFVPLIVVQVFIGRWSASAHFGRALMSEIQTAGVCTYRITVGHLARFLFLGAALDGIERRLPRAIADAPGADKPKRATGMFEHYTIVASLKGGGSGGKLYIAEPDQIKKAAFERSGQADVNRVVIKSFSVADGSSVPQIVRESRALEAAKRLGLVLEHELDDHRFHYVMRYVPGESLSAVTERMHAQAEGGALSNDCVKRALAYVADVTQALGHYHEHGLWHKDVKPDNIIIDEHAKAEGRPRANLVDFGLVTPLRSAMTLTTHGTEYFRDPELVRQALRGAKVHQIDGARFDVYAAGAVLYSIIENEFPAHGGLSQVSKRCPESVRWIIRRAMTDYDKRYPTAQAMLADLQTVLAADDPFSVKPAQLPSMGGDMPAIPEVPVVAVEAPDLRVERRAATPAAAYVPAAAFDEPAAPKPYQRGGRHAPAKEQLANARARLQKRRESARRASTRRAELRGERREKTKSKLFACSKKKGSPGSAIAGFVIMAFLGFTTIAMISFVKSEVENSRSQMRASRVDAAAVANARVVLRDGRPVLVTETSDGEEREVSSAEALAAVENIVENVGDAFSEVNIDEDSIRRLTDRLSDLASRARSASRPTVAPTPALYSDSKGYLKGLRVLVVGPSASSLSSETTAEVLDQLRGLSDAGAVLGGDLVAPPSDSAAADREERLLAEMELLRTQVSPDSAGFAAKLRDFIGGQEDVDAVLWLNIDPSKKKLRDVIAADRDGSLRTNRMTSLPAMLRDSVSIR